MANGVDLPDDIVVQGLGHRSFFVPGELDAKGNAAWSVDGKEWFQLDTHETRYQDCLALAHELRAQYPMDGLDPNNPADLKKITANEEAITTALNQKIHQEYGDYNTAIAAGADSRTHPSMHQDIARADSNNPAGLEDFRHGELVCRHYAPLANALCSEAGMNVARMDSVFTADYNVGEDSLTAKGDVGFHTAVISLSTGNLIEATAAKNGNPYKQKVNDISVEDILAGRTLIVGDEYRLTAIGPGYAGGAPQELLAERQASIGDGKFDLLPKWQQYEGGSKGHDQFKDEKIAPEFLREAQAVYQQKVQGATRDFETAVDKALASGKPEDVENVRDTLERMPISNYEMANVLQRAVKAQNWELTELALDEGALQGFRAGFTTAQLPLLVDGEKADPRFIKQLLDKTDTSVTAYQRAAEQHYRTDHADTIQQIRSGAYDTPAPSLTESIAEEKTTSAKTPEPITPSVKEETAPIQTQAGTTPIISAVIASTDETMGLPPTPAKPVIQETAAGAVKVDGTETAAQETAAKPSIHQNAVTGDIRNPGKSSAILPQRETPAEDEEPSNAKGTLQQLITSFFGNSAIAQILLAFVNVLPNQMPNGDLGEIASRNASAVTPENTPANEQNLDNAKRAVDQLKASGKLVAASGQSHIEDGTEVSAIVPQEAKSSVAQVG